MSAIKAGWLYSGPYRSEQSQGWYVPVMDKDGTLKLVDTYVIKSRYSEHDKNVSAMTAAILEMGTEPHPYVFSRALSDFELYWKRDFIKSSRLCRGKVGEGITDCACLAI